MLGFDDRAFLDLLGQRIVALRMQKGMSQRELAYRIGMETSNLSVIENGKSNPQILTLVKIASSLNVELKEILDFNFDYSNFLEAQPTYTPRKHNKKD
jgi:transcriptional regulator with XRE-family HTH domain